MKNLAIIGAACAAAIYAQSLPGIAGGGIDDVLRSLGGARAASKTKPAAAKASVYPPYTESTRLKVPLRQGLTVVTAVSEQGRDYESIKQVTAISGTLLRLHYSADRPGAAHIEVDRDIRRDDLRKARRYQMVFDPEGPGVYAGTTSLGTSSLVLSELKSHGESAFSFEAGGLLNFGVLIGKALDAAGGEGRTPAEGSGAGKLWLVSKNPVGIPVVVNDARVILPALHAQMDSGDGDFYFLDDTDNAIALSWRTGAGDVLQDVKLSFPAGEPGPRLEQQLKNNQRASVYGIYFDSGSADIRAESESVLQEIAAAMRKNPSWKLQLEGHTDNIGGDAYNLDLSRQRSAAVRKTLIEKHGIAAERLASAGFGQARPKAPNDTLEGRALNRRVELVRQP